MNYKDTLNLPQTDFPMRAQLPKREPEFQARWEKEKTYQQVLDRRAREGSADWYLHWGPPFANGDAHIGHALSKTLKDAVVRSRSMSGYRAPLVPGWDCHGLPIEHKVMKELGAKGRDLDPVEIRQKCEETARHFMGVQREQFKRLGVFAEWDAPYVTMDPSYEADILRSFATIVGKGLVYQGLRPVQWSSGCGTALAEAEVEYKEKTDPAIFVKFPLNKASAKKVLGRGSAFLCIWTTTPWTLPANLAVAVEPSLDYGVYTMNRQRYICAKVLKDRIPGLEKAKDSGETLKGADLEGLIYEHPFLDREGAVYGADFVTADTGTGLVHIAPGHGADDYVLGRAKGLEVLSPVDDAGCLTKQAGRPELEGLYVFKANPVVIDILKEQELLLAVEDYKHDYPHCWRSGTPIIFRAVKQWFIKVDEFRQQALDEIEKVQWIPPWGKNRIRGAVENRPDWCISRQRTWGVPIPVFYGEGGQALLSEDKIRAFADIVEQEGTDVWFASETDVLATRLGLPKGLKKGNETLDVWIDSGTSHAAVARKRLRFPADLYLEGSDQHRGWFQSSLSTSVAMTGEAPYKAVLTHGFVVDGHGHKFSKSKGAKDLAGMINDFGADILRLWVISQDFTNDVPFSKEIVQVVSTAYRSIRNALRILLANLNDFDVTANALPREEWTEVDRYIDARLQDLIAECRTAYDNFEFHVVYHAINRFVAVDLSALYIDLLKDRMYCDAVDDKRRRSAQTVLDRILRAIVKLLAPLIPFTSEEAWQFLGEKESVHLELFPQPDRQEDDAFLVRWEKLLALRGRINEKLEALRRDKVIGKSLEARVQLETPDFVAEDADLLRELCIVSQFEVSVADAEEIAVAPANGGKCPRCWRFYEELPAESEDACERCVEVVESLDFGKA